MMQKWRRFLVTKPFVVCVSKYFEVFVDAEDEDEALTIAEDEVEGRDFNDGDFQFEVMRLDRW